MTDRTIRQTSQAARRFGSGLGPRLRVEAGPAGSDQPALGFEDVFNWFTARFTGVSMHDMNCGFKAYRGECARSIELYGEMHRYMPVLATQQGWRVSEVPVNHRARQLRPLPLRPRAIYPRCTRPAHRGFPRPIPASAATSFRRTRCGAESDRLPDRRLPDVLRSPERASVSGRCCSSAVLLIVVGVQLLTLGLLGQMLVLTRREVGGKALEHNRIERSLLPVSAVSPADGREPRSTESSAPR